MDWTKPQTLVLSRALCAFERIDSNPDMSSAKRRKAAELQARINSPFSDPGLYLQPSGDGFAAWTWDVANATARSGLPGQFAVPESVGVEGKDGLLLVESIDGYEGQIWQAGRLHQSRWWPAMPTMADWRLFLAGSGAGRPVGDVPTVAVQGFAPDRLVKARSSVPAVSRLAAIPARAKMGWAAVILLPVAAYIFTHLAASTIDARQTRSEVETLRAQLTDKRAAAAELRRMQSRLSDYAGLDLNAPVLPSLATTLSMVDALDGEVRRLSVLDGEVVMDFRTTAQDFDTVSWVRQLEADPTLSDVTIARATRRNEWTLEARIPAPGGGRS
jgi:hypothetical protein